MTVFRIPEATALEQNWWQELVGEPPEISTTKPKTGELQQSGPFGEGKLFLQIQKDRIDWVHAPGSESEEVAGSAMLLPQSLNLFVSIMKRGRGLSRHHETSLWCCPETSGPNEGGRV